MNKSYAISDGHVVMLVNNDNASFSAITASERKIGYSDGELRWLRFDVGLGEFVPDVNCTEDFWLDIEGDLISLTPTDGMAKLVFDGSPGIYNVKTVNEGVWNAGFEVVIP